MRSERDEKWVDFGQVAEKEGRLQDTIDREKLTKKLLTATVKDLRQGLFQNEFTSLDLVLIYGARCQDIGRQLHFSTEEMFLEAIEQAKKCDAERQKAL